MKRDYFSTMRTTHRRLHTVASRIFVVAILGLLPALVALGQSGAYQIPQSVVAGGGGAGAAGSVSIEGTAGQPAITTSTNGGYTVSGGFWAGPVSNLPTAAPAFITGRVSGSDGLPLAGVVIVLSGNTQATTITKADGSYSFSHAEVGGFYVVTPFRANYTFSPPNRSFSLTGNRTDAVFTAIADAIVTANPLDAPEFFVRQQYLDLLGREPDQGGFDYWSDQIRACGTDVTCQNVRRRDVAAAFFVEREFQESGSFIYDLYLGALGRRPAFAEYTTDRNQVVAGTELEAKKNSLARDFVQRAELVQKYQANTSAESFVLALLQNVRWTGVDLSARTEALIGVYNTGSNLIESRAAVVRTVADDVTFKQSQYNQAFVLTEYFVYLQRDPDQPGLDFWLNILNAGGPENYRRMVCAFITSAEYQRRFSSIVTHGNDECGR